MGVIDGLDPSYTDIQEPFTQTHTHRQSLTLGSPTHTKTLKTSNTDPGSWDPPARPPHLPPIHTQTHTHTAPQHFSTPPWNSPAQVLLEAATSSQLRQRLRCQLPALPQVASLPIHTSLPEPVPPLGPCRWWSDPESPSIPVDTCPRPLPIHPSLPIFSPFKGKDAPSFSPLHQSPPKTQCLPPD